MTLLDAIREFANRVHVKPDTMKQIWPFQLMEFAACEIWTQNARIEGWVGKKGAPFLGGEMEREHNYLVSCALIRQAIFKIKDEQWELSKKTMLYTTQEHLKKLLERNKVFMENAKRDLPKDPFNSIRINVHDIIIRYEHIQQWFWSSNADLWDRGVKNYETSLEIIDAAINVIMEEIKILEEYSLKYQLSDDFH